MAQTEPALDEVQQQHEEPFYWLNEDSRAFLNEGYLLEGVTAEERVREIGERAEEILDDDGFADKFYDYMSRGFYSLASPVWSNFGLDRGLPISCFGSYMADSMESILYTQAEVGEMTKLGGGTSGYFGEIRPRGSPITNNGKSNGSYSFTELFDTIINVVSQGETRRGQFAGYIDIEHDDLDEWLNIKTEGDPVQDIYYGVIIGDDWFQAMVDGDEEKRETWAEIIETRINIGVPYIIFRDNMNDGKPQVYKDKGYEINASNLCTEIALPATPDESFVCCLSSMNALHYDEWKDTDAVETLTRFLDAVMEEFIQEAEGTQFMERPVRFAKRHRAIGIGVLGWHSYLQSEMIPFDSMEAMEKNEEIFRTIKERSYEESRRLADEFGEPEVLDGYGRRNATTMSVAPTKSSSVILGQVSPSIEPLKSNYFVRDGAKLKSTQKNRFLEGILKQRGRDEREVWDSIAQNDGSVQHLDCLTDEEKEVFKTFAEIPQMAIINQAAQRQKHIDQAQSLNVSIDPSEVSVKEINQLYIEAWKKGVKSLYYQHSVNAAQKFSRDILECKACES
ncbi:ribonucleoside-diphosphate reductase subunit alpha [Halorubrum ezzemoulense]|uniref:Ribonucleoside-diphosphate reductase alpha chain n=1 Tax=Halorubrum ezzemoulense TaxID=337243 RepID=A0A256JEP9_HALEZ|nr:MULTISPECIES: ribonucleoside-diphosphate reductase subunit alpha [Halorubrum]MDB2226414.1 ribonucleoside-diphosphate reductase subunit alpha [Halorubrum ezzemoulense]MDB2246406.1 ribonucleoside-diphosphate reductase subunit alpha [Halorubrum ezzemoulense]MDB2253465.1 ribonucleoside-diphosphate reductase subunit alpha [Halorubrum ezzemoulense]MDB2262392.1 ribonucleoside-diphosphate reductase subunit alpha [Halorubrum ezzemoulense]MDB2265153.1 ribonucleoside-diphosphate reductase subunit alph